MLCATPNLFYRTPKELPDALSNEIMNDIMKIEDSSISEIQPLPAQFADPKRELAQN